MTKREIATVYSALRRLSRAARVAGDRGGWEVARINLRAVSHLVSAWEIHLKAQR